MEHCDGLFQDFTELKETVVKIYDGFSIEWSFQKVIFH